MTPATVLALPARVTRWFFPDIDQQAWKFMLVLAVCAALALKEATLPLWLMAALVAGLFAGFLRGAQPKSAFLFYLLVAYLPFSRVLAPQSGSGIPGLNFLNLLTVSPIIAIVWEQRRARNAVRLEVGVLGWAIALFAVLTVASWLRAGWLYGSWYMADQASSVTRLLKPMSYFFITLWVVRERQVAQTTVALIMAAVAAVGLMAMYEYMDRAGSSFDQSRVHGVAGQANAMGAFFVTYMFVLLAPFMRRPWHRPHAVWLFAFLVCARGIMTTFSRGAYVGCAVGGLVMCWLRHKGLFIAAVALGLLLLLNPAWLPEGIRYRLESTIAQRPRAQETDELAQQLESSAGNRLYIWSAAQRMIADHPWVGAGFGMTPQLMPHYTRGAIDHLDAHNMFLNIAAEEGLPAMAVFLIILGLACAAAYRLTRRAPEEWSAALGMGLLAGLIGLMAANCFTTTMQREETTGYLWMLTALAIRILSLEHPVSRGGAA